jgi:ubiquinone/menaquinone biosynthesis C-methylase UbiE
MEFTGERFIPGQTGRIEAEHLNRYYFVTNQIDLSDKIILDLASGEGYGTNILAEHAKFIYGIDISDEAIIHAKAKYSKPNLSFIVGNAIQIPLPDHSIDVFVSFETIEHHDKHIEMLNEIKRVLKPSGILVMSSPDRFYYSELPKYKNEFHVKELYNEEFRILINRYFKFTTYYAQKIFTGSIISLDEEQQIYKKPLIVEKDGNSSNLTPMYNLVIGTEDINFKPPLQLVLYKESDDLLTIKDFERAILAVKNTKTYKLGNIFISPFRFVRALFRKAFLLQGRDL